MTVLAPTTPTLAMEQITQEGTSPMSRKLKLLTLTVPAAIAALSAVPLATAAPIPTCPTVAPSTVFAQWGDTSPYVLSEGGSMEDAKWWKGAKLVADDDSYKLGKYSLRLLNGTSATSAWVCQGSAYPTMRFMVRNAGSATAKLDVLMYVSGVPLAVKLATITAGSSWAPSPIISVPTALLPAGITISNVQVAFVASGTGADFRVDDLFIDPRSRG
jgi:hypothetical protein